MPARPKDAAAAGFAFALASRCARLRPEAGIVWIAEDMVAREIGLPYGRRPAPTLFACASPRREGCSAPSIRVPAKTPQERHGAGARHVTEISTASTAAEPAPSP